MQEIWTSNSCLIPLSSIHKKIEIGSYFCNFPFFCRGQVCYRWKDSCGFMRSLLSKLQHVTSRGPLSENNKRPHVLLLSTKALASGKTYRNIVSLSCGLKNRTRLNKKIISASYIPMEKAVNSYTAASFKQ